MDFEKPVLAPSPEEIGELIQNYTTEEVQTILEETQTKYDQRSKEIEKLKEKIYSGIRQEIINNKTKHLSDKAKHFFLTNLKEEDFELASKLNKQ